MKRRYDLPRVPDGFAPLSAEELEAYRRNAPLALLTWRRESWLLELAAKGLVPIKGSVSARIFLVKRVLPELFPETYRATGRFVRCDDDLPTALEALGPETRKIVIETGNTQPMTVHVAASTRAAALDHLESCGLTPKNPGSRHRPEK